MNPALGPQFAEDDPSVFPVGFSQSKAMTSSRVSFFVVARFGVKFQRPSTPIFIFISTKVSFVFASMYFLGLAYREVNGKPTCFARVYISLRKV